MEGNGQAGLTRVITALLMIALLVAVAAAGIGIGWGIGTTVSPSARSSSTGTTTTQVAGNTSPNVPYSLTVAETIGNVWNSTAGTQPKFLVQGARGFVSSANIVLPSHRLIQLTFVSYDTPEPDATAQEAQVTGTVGGTVYLVNGTVASNSNASMFSASTGWGQNVTSVPVNALSHTFTIQQLGINIPVVGGSTVVAYVYFDKPGTYTWDCITPCGLGSDGLSGAMNTAGWMTGTVTVT